MESYKYFIGVGGIIENDNRFLLVEEANGPLKNKWGFPSGLVNNDETIQKAIERELFEETGLITKLNHIVFIGNLLDSRWHRPELYIGCKLETPQNLIINL